MDQVLDNFNGVPLRDNYVKGTYRGPTVDGVNPK